MMAYFSNSSEGDILERQCCECIHEDPDAGCPVALVQMMFNYDQMKDGNHQLKTAMSILIDEDGTCKMKEAIQIWNIKQAIKKGGGQ